MKKNLFFCTILLILAVLTPPVSGQGTEKDTRDLKGFTRISFGIAGDLNIKIGPEFRVVLEGQQSDLDEIITEVSGDRLIIKQDSWRFNFRDKVTINITLPELTGLGVSGSGKAEILDPIKNADDLSLSVSGSGKLLTAGIEVDAIDCSISGSGNIVIGAPGSADRGKISISGSGNFTGQNIEVDHLDVHVSGSGNCQCKAGDSLSASISGSGNITYSGDPKIDVRVSGSGQFRYAIR